MSQTSPAGQQSQSQSVGPHPGLSEVAFKRAVGETPPSPDDLEKVEWFWFWLWLWPWVGTEMSLPAGSAAGSSAGIVFTHGPILRFFRPAGAIRCIDQGEIWQGGADHRSAPPCQISPWSAQGWGFTAPKLKKMEFYQYNCP